MAVQDRLLTIEDVPRIAYRLARKRGLTHHNAEDLAQDIVVECLERPPGYLTTAYLAMRVASRVADPRPRVLDGPCPFDPTELLEGLQAPDQDEETPEPESQEDRLRRLTPVERDVADRVLAGGTLLDIDRGDHTAYRAARSGARRMRRR